MMGTIDSDGNVHDTQGRFAGRVHCEPAGGLNTLSTTHDDPQVAETVTRRNGSTEIRFVDGSTKSILPNGMVEYRNRSGCLHRDDDLPAVELLDGTRMWYQDGRLHRDGDLPAVEDADGTKEWFRDDKRHRDGAPAIERPDGTREWWRDDELHREGDRPAAVYTDGTKKWFRDGKRHRDGGPAIERPDGTVEYWVNGRRVDPPAV